MSATTLIPNTPVEAEEPWVLPYRGKVGMFCLIIAESAIFMIFVIAYLYNIGKSLYGPQPAQVLELPIFASVCLWASSLTIHVSEHFVERGKIKLFGVFWAATMILGTIFLVYTGFEWHDLIFNKGLTIKTNLFGTTFYSLVGLHATHVLIGLIIIVTTMIFTLMGKVKKEHTERIKTFALYWHFVDAVWIVVFIVVYVVGR